MKYLNDVANSIEDDDRKLDELLVAADRIDKLITRMANEYSISISAPDVDPVMLELNDDYGVMITQTLESQLRNHIEETNRILKKYGKKWDDNLRSDPSLTPRLVYDSILNASTDYIAHQVNFCGVIGGLARQIFDEYSVAQLSYLRYCKAYLIKIGTAICPTNPDDKIISLFDQDEPGANTDYSYLKNALADANRQIPADSTVAFPYGMGCGIGGGDWTIVEPMILAEFGNRAVIYKYDGRT